MKILTNFFRELDKLMLMFIWKDKCAYIVKEHWIKGYDGV